MAFMRSVFGVFTAHNCNEVHCDDPNHYNDQIVMLDPRHNTVVCLLNGVVHQCMHVQDSHPFVDETAHRCSMSMASVGDTASSDNWMDQIEEDAAGDGLTATQQTWKENLAFAAKSCGKRTDAHSLIEKSLLTKTAYGTGTSFRFFLFFFFLPGFYLKKKKTPCSKLLHFFLFVFFFFLGPTLKIPHAETSGFEVSPRALDHPLFLGSFDDDVDTITIFEDEETKKKRDKEEEASAKSEAELMLPPPPKRPKIVNIKGVSNPTKKPRPQIPFSALVNGKTNPVAIVAAAIVQSTEEFKKDEAVLKNILNEQQSKSVAPSSLHSLTLRGTETQPHWYGYYRRRYWYNSCNLMDSNVYNHRHHRLYSSKMAFSTVNDQHVAIHTGMVLADYFWETFLVTNATHVDAQSSWDVDRYHHEAAAYASAVADTLAKMGRKPVAFLHATSKHTKKSDITTIASDDFRKPLRCLDSIANLKPRPIKWNSNQLFHLLARDLQLMRQNDRDYITRCLVPICTDSAHFYKALKLSILILATTLQQGYILENSSSSSFSTLNPDSESARADWMRYFASLITKSAEIRSRYSLIQHVLSHCKEIISQNGSALQSVLQKLIRLSLSTSNANGAIHLVALKDFLSEVVDSWR